MLGVGIFLGLLGPFGSFSNPGGGKRLVYWSISLMIGFLLFGGSFYLLRRRLAGFSTISSGMAACLIVVVVCGVQTLVTRGLALLVWSDSAVHFPDFLEWYFQVLLIALPLCLGTMFLRRFSHAGSVFRETRDLQTGQDAGNNEPSARPGTGCIDDFPRPDSVLAMQMEDHYIRCYNPADSRLVYGVFREAVERLAGQDGMQVHRSWWVARRAVTGWEGSSRAMKLHLSNNMIVPVSRQRVAELRLRGWICPEDEVAKKPVSD